MPRPSSRETQRLVEHLLRALQNPGARRGRLILVAGVVLLLVAYVVARPSLERRFGISLPNVVTGDPPSPSTSQRASRRASPPTAPPTISAGEDLILAAFDDRRSNVVVRSAAIVKKLLRDDDVGDRHQKMILTLPSGHTLLLAHNIDLAERVPVREGDEIEFCGEYEFSEQGGVVHWTHHDPAGRHEDGWIRHRDRRYD